MCNYAYGTYVISESMSKIIVQDTPITVISVEERDYRVDRAHGLREKNLSYRDILLILRQDSRLIAFMRGCRAGGF